MDESLFSELDLWLSGPAEGAFQMAVDEILLRSVSRPLLRVWDWERPTISFGCLMSVAEARAENRRGWPMVRRWTGGGLVHHAPGDTTYSLIVPAAALGTLGSVDPSYALIHQAVASALRRGGIDAHLATDGRPQLGGACFEKPVGHDVMLNGRKIAGAGQRRTKAGLLHQGAIQGLPPLPELPRWLAEALGSIVLTFAGITEEMQCAATTLAAEKYTSEDWLTRR